MKLIFLLSVLLGSAQARLIGKKSPLRRLDVKVFEEQGGLVVIETESVSVVEPWQLESSVSGFTGTGYIRFDGNDVSGGEPDGVISYFFTISTPGTYRMSLRSYKDNEDATVSNDCYTRIVGYAGEIGSFTKTFMRGSPNAWNYNTQYSLQDDTKPVPELRMATGQYELQIAGRSKNFYIDRIVFYDESVVDESFAESTDRQESSSSTASEPVSTSEPVPTLEPVPTPAPTSVPVSEPAPVDSLPSSFPQLFIDAGSDSEDLSLVNGTSWDAYFNATIQGIPTLYKGVAEAFKSHRSGESFSYQLVGYSPSERAVITLGFAENWVGGCRTGKRTFNVKVNNEEFATDLDVFGTVGCYTALVMSKSFTANDSGVFAIEFIPVTQNPFVAFIGVDPVDFETETNVPSSAPVDTPSSSSSLITGLTLVNAESRDAIISIIDGDSVNLNTIKASLLSIRADTKDTVNLVIFRYDGLTHEESKAPFVMNGKNGAKAFNAVAYLTSPGEKNVTVYAQDVSGVVENFRISFTIVDENFSADVWVESIPEPDVFIDAGSADEDIALFSGNVWETQYYQYPIADVPSIYDEVTFQSHRSGMAPFNYTIGGFIPGELAEVTLGFAENYEVNCGKGKRVFTVTVNDQPFATDLDVFAVTGCYQALLISKSYAANSDGYFVVDFLKGTNHPMVSLITIDSLEKDLASDMPSSMPSDYPSSMPSDYPSSMPSDYPSSIPSDYPSSMPLNVPSGVPTVEGLVRESSLTNQPIPFTNLSSDLPSNSPSDSPSDTPSDTPSDFPSDYPSDYPSTAPSDSPSTAPSDARSTISSWDTPGNKNTPMDAPNATSTFVVLTLVNADNRDSIAVLAENGTLVILDAMGTTSLSIRADIPTTSDMHDKVHRVRFAYDGMTYTDDAAPFVMHGKNGDAAFAAVPYLSAAGQKMLKVDVVDSYGVVLDSATVSFTVIER